MEIKKELKGLFVNDRIAMDFGPYLFGRYLPTEFNKLKIPELKESIMEKIDFLDKEANRLLKLIPTESSDKNWSYRLFEVGFILKEDDIEIISIKKSNLLKEFDLFVFNGLELDWFRK